MTDYLQSILNAFHDLLFVFSKDGVIEDFLSSQGEEELLQPKAAFLGKHHTEVLPPHVSKEIDKAIEKIDQGETQYRFDYTLELDGEQQWFVAVFSKIDYKDEPRYLGTVRNITDRKTQELLLRGVLNTSPGGIMVFRCVRDSNDEIKSFEFTHVNRTVEEISGYQEEELVGKELSFVAPEEVAKTITDNFKTAVNEERRVEFEYSFKNDAGEIIWHLAEAAKFKDGIVTTFLDITAQKRAEEKLRTTNEQLKELNRQKDKLFSVISHDLRNAISGTMGVYDIIFDDYEELSKEELREYLTLLRKGSNNAIELLEDLLLWSRNQFQEVKLELKKIELAKVASSAMDSVKANAEDKGITLKNKIPANLVVHADADIVKTVLRNLITNGIKFSQPGGKIIVESEKKEGEIEVSVSDKGVGMDKEVIEKVMDKKSTYTTTGTAGEKGSGLGLDLCIDFVEKHGGEIWAKSKPGEGSTFFFTLPADISN